MTLDLTNPVLILSFLPSTYHILRLPRSLPVPPPLLALLSTPPTPTSFLSLTLTPTETSLILPSAAFHALDLTSPASPETASEGPWAILRVRGPMELHLTGIMHALLGPLKDAGVAIFASSTYDTDYVLVREEVRGRAVEALRGAGWVVEE